MIEKYLLEKDEVSKIVYAIKHGDAFDTIEDIMTERINRCLENNNKIKSKEEVINELISKLQVYGFKIIIRSNNIIHNAYTVEIWQYVKHKSIYSDLINKFIKTSDTKQYYTLEYVANFISPFPDDNSLTYDLKSLLETAEKK
jgi:hypothetical protein